MCQNMSYGRERYTQDIYESVHWSLFLSVWLTVQSCYWSSTSGHLSQDRGSKHNSRHSIRCQRLSHCREVMHHTYNLKPVHRGHLTNIDWLTDILAWISNYIHSFRSDVVNFLCNNLNGGVPMKLGYGWVSISHHFWRCNCLSMSKCKCCYT